MGARACWSAAWPPGYRGSAPQRSGTAVARRLARQGPPAVVEQDLEAPPEGGGDVRDGEDDEVGGGS